MIRSIDISNFRCFERLKIDDCRRINVIVGDNGSGKTALLEAVFFALGTSPDLALRFRQQRGLEGSFSGSVRRIEEAIWRDYFYNRDWQRTAKVELTGDGSEARSVRLFRGLSQVSIPLELDSEQAQPLTSPIAIVWRDAEGKEHETYPKVTASGLQFESSDEDTPDFSSFLLIKRSHLWRTPVDFLN